MGVDEPMSMHSAWPAAPAAAWANANIERDGRTGLRGPLLDGYGFHVDTALADAMYNGVRAGVHQFMLR